MYHTQAAFICVNKRNPQDCNLEGFTHNQPTAYSNRVNEGILSHNQSITIVGLIMFRLSRSQARVLAFNYHKGVLPTMRDFAHHGFINSEDKRNKLVTEIAQALDHADDVYDHQQLDKLLTFILELCIEFTSKNVLPIHKTAWKDFNNNHIH